MSQQAATERVRTLIQSAPVVLFMKGNRRSPRCGFSASVIEILDDVLDDYLTVDVLEDDEVREAVKAVADWPTIPQLFIQGEFVGGADIVREMAERGELIEALGGVVAAPQPPRIELTDAAASAIREALEGAGGDPATLLRVTIDGQFRNDLALARAEPSDLRTESNGVAIACSPATARRADGLRIDYVEEGGDAGFRLDNPNAPPVVKDMSVKELALRLRSGKPFQFVDVRTEGERRIATIEGSRLLDDAYLEELTALPKTTTLVFHCHHGGRSLRAAQRFVEMGFTDVYNVIGGIDAWSSVIDPKVAKY